MKSRRELGIYVHIPFCVRKCDYCDFLSAPADRSVQEDYMQALLREISRTAQLLGKKTEDYEVQSVFFGGGTPSAVGESWIVQIMEALYRHFCFSGCPEVTIECNPGTLTKQKAAAYRKAGINRISFGLQAADDRLLKILGRIHTVHDFERSMETARSEGFGNINIDVMSALPGQTLADCERGIRRIMAYAPEHISAYSLIVEEGTPLFNNPDRYPPLPDEDEEREMYYRIRELLGQGGYRQYEISNFAREGFECRHNLSYWNRADYLGFGLGAASLFEGCRMTNIRSLTEYIKAAGAEAVIGEEARLSREDSMEEFMFLGLRKTAGIDGRDFERMFGQTVESVYGSVLDKHIKLGLLEKTGQSAYRLTYKGVDVSNVVLSEFLLPRD